MIRLTDKDRDMIRCMYKYKFSIYDIAKKFGVSYGTIRNVILRKGKNNQ